MPDLPHIQHGHAPLDVCHKSHSGVAHHVMPGCACDSPRQTIAATFDKLGNMITPEHEVIVPDLVTINEMVAGKPQSRSVSIEDAKRAGLIV